MRAPDGSPAYWLVPFVAGKLACGFARVELDGAVAQLGTFGGGAEDRGAWPPASFFESPPRRSLAEIAQRHPGAAAADAVLTYDRSPSRWGWRVALGPDRAAFIGPAGWYVRDSS